MELFSSASGCFGEHSFVSGKVFILMLGGNVELKNKTTSYFTSKIGLFRNIRELQFRTSKLWQNHRPIWRKKEKGLL